MKRLLPVVLAVAGATASAGDNFSYNSEDGSCMSRPKQCQLFPRVSEEAAFASVGEINGKYDAGSKTLVRAENDVKVNGEACYSILAGDYGNDGFVTETRYAVGMHSGNIYRYDVVANQYEALRISGKQLVDRSVFRMIPVTPDTKFLAVPDGRIPFMLKVEDSSIVIEAAGKHWSQKFSVPVVKADFWQVLVKGKIFVAFSLTHADFREDSQILELSSEGIRSAGFFPGIIKNGIEEKLYFTRRIAMGPTIWEGQNFASMTEGVFAENSYFAELTDTYHPNSRLKLVHNLRMKKVDLEGTAVTVNGYSDEKSGALFTFERFYPNSQSPLLENVASVYFTVQDGTVVLKSQDTGAVVALEHTSVRNDEEDSYTSYFDGIAFDNLFSME
ncbi:MAG: hypothetical protein IJ523_05645 [Succinivibrionaceae bacterium]|nr:hypothetical protein [Succinivibrionaceae bacterium]